MEIAILRRHHPAMSRLHLLMFLLLLGSFAYFHHRAPGWNVKSRLALTHAIVEKRTFKIDAYINRPDLETGDASLYKGHYYSDKIIGTSLLGVPAYAGLRAVESIFDFTMRPEPKRYWITLLAVGVPGALSGVLLFHWLLMLQVRWRPPSQDPATWEWGAFVVTVATYIGTLLFSYATLFMSYLPATLFLLGAVVWFERHRLQSTQPSQPPLFVCGVLAGLSVLCEYTYGIAAGLLFLYMIPSARPWWRTWRYVAGGIMGVSPFLIYTWSIFGSIAIPYQYHMNEEFRAGMAKGLMGATWPNVHPLALITFHPFKGLFVQSLFLVLALVGGVAMVAKAQSRQLGLFIGASLLCYLLFNSAYYMWWGGWSFSPRHLAPAVPLLAPAVFFLWRYVWARFAMVVLAVPSVALHLVVTATDPQVPDGKIAGLKNPDLTLYDYPSQLNTQVWPAFNIGRIDPNLGTLVGLSPGAFSLLPLIGFWLVIGILLCLCLRTSRQSPNL